MVEWPPISSESNFEQLGTSRQSLCQLVEAMNVGFGSQIYPPGVELFHQGAVLGEIFFVEAGVVKLVSCEESGQELIVDIRFEGSLPGLSAVIRNQPQPLSAATVSHCRVRRITSGRFFDLLSQDIQIAASIHHVLSGEVINQAARIAEICTLTARQRLENFIWQVTKQANRPEQNNSKLQLPLKQWEVAQFLAITPAYLSRLLAELESEEKIVRRNGWIIVCTIGSLWHRAE